VTASQGDRSRERGSERRDEWLAAAAFLVCGAAGIGLAAVYLEGGQPQLEGILLAVAFGGLAFGLVWWARTLLPNELSVQERHDLATSEPDREAFEDDLERGHVDRRHFLLRALGVGLGGLGVAALFPIRSLGPSPGRALYRTPWRRGLKLVTESGTPVRVADVPFGGLVTVFPEGSPGSADGQAVLMRVQPGQLTPAPGRESWTPDGLVAYSKICTHAGCPVGLFEASTNQLLCPCHQSAFDVLHGARPVFGPAAAPLPQLPLSIVGDEIQADGDFSDPVGPAFWRRDR
jgi:ubiquinol-cytochrome c reductase iron-sulfur subunit